jgi:hypothetical protein
MPSRHFVSSLGAGPDPLTRGCPRRSSTADAHEARLAIPASEPHRSRPEKVRGLRTERPATHRGTGTRSDAERSTAMTLLLIAQLQCLSAQTWRQVLVYLAEPLRYNPLHEIAVQEAKHAVDPFAGRSSESLAPALEACVEVGRVSREGPAKD